MFFVVDSYLSITIDLKITGNLPPQCTILFKGKQTLQGLFKVWFIKFLKGKWGIPGIFRFLLYNEPTLLLEVSDGMPYAYFFRIPN